MVNAEERRSHWIWDEGQIRIVSKSTQADQFATPRPAGQRLRGHPDKWDAFLNDYQAELVDHYDIWSRDTTRILARQKGSGATAVALRRTLAGRIQNLEVDLMGLGRQRLFEAGMRGLGDRFAHRADTVSVQQTISQLQARNDTFLVESLMPDVRRAFAGTLAEPDVGALRTALGEATKPFRARVAGYSGGATVAVFETQKRAGIDENVERVSRGEAPIAVRWVLDPGAEHCEDDPSRGTFGCPGLAGVYAEGFESLPTVPAGNVSCLGNCKCHIQLNDGSGWERA